MTEEDIQRHTKFLKFIKSKTNEITFEEFTTLIDIFYLDIIEFNKYRKIKEINSNNEDNKDD